MTLTGMSKAETFFLGQIAETLGDDSVLASGYFRTFMKDRSGSGTAGKLATFGDAARARGYFLALTDSAIAVVETRAPATSAPLLENAGTTSISLSDVTGVSMTHELLLIESSGKILPLQMATKNKAFPRQDALINELAKRFDLPESAESIQAAQRQKLLKTIGLIAVVIVIAIAWAAFK